MKIDEFTKDTIYTTERLIVRRLVHEDYSGFHEMQGDFEVMQYVAKKANTEEEDSKDIDHVINCYSKVDNDFWVWAIEEKNSRKFVGTVAIINDKEDNWEIGYRLPKRQWGKGYATEVTNGLIETCEQIDEIDNLIAYADLRNVGSQRVLTKVGFINLGIKYNEEEDCEDYIYTIRTTV